MELLSDQNTQNAIVQTGTDLRELVELHLVLQSCTSIHTIADGVKVRVQQLSPERVKVEMEE